jgi:hypothetical protein
VEHVLEATGLNEHTAAVKRGKPSRLLWLHGRDLLEEAVNGPPHQFAHGPVLLPGHVP